MNKTLVKITIIALFIFTNLMWLAVGLWPYTFHPANNVSLNDNNHCLTFGDLSHAFIQSSFLNNQSTFTDNDSFSLEFIIRPQNFTFNHIPRIISVNDNNDDLFFIGQYKRGFVVEFKNGKKVILGTGKHLNLTTDHPVLLSVVKYNTTIELFVNGKLIASKTELPLNTLRENKILPVVLGNSAKGNQQWIGELYALAAFNKKLSPQEIESQYTFWVKDNSYSQLSDNSVLFYSFDNKFQRTYKNGSPGNALGVLEIPAFVSQLQKDYLTPPWIDFRWEKDYAIDVILNLLAFIILGILATATFSYHYKSRNLLILLSTLNSFIISITIETLQIYLPTRSSQLSDLILNTTGGFLGALIFLKFAPAIETLFQTAFRLTWAKEQKK